MVNTSGVRERLRSGALAELAKERSSKRLRLGEKSDETKDVNAEDDTNSDQELESTRFEIEQRMAKIRKGDCSLLSILPRPKNASSFGPTVRLDELLKLQAEAEEDPSSLHSSTNKEALNIGEDGMIEVDVGKEIGTGVSSAVKELTIEKSKAVVIIPKGKERQKNQLSYLAQLSKATELEQKERAAQGRANKAAARSKYGW